MIWIWVAIGVVVIALVVLAVVVAGTAGRLKPLKRALDEQGTRDDALALQGRIADLQAASMEVQERVQVTQERVASLKSAGSPESD